MEKDKEKNNVTQQQPAAPVVENPNEQEWFAGMEEAYPDLKGDREALFKASKEGYDKQHAYYKKAVAEQEQLNAILESDPDLNAMFTEIFERGKDGNPGLALHHMRPLMKKYVNGEITSEEYLAEQKRMQEEDAALQKKQAMQQAAFVKECEERGWDVEETLTKLNEVMNGPCETEEQCREQVRNIFKILDYDPAVAAAEVRGKNSKITEEKRKNSGGQMGNNGASAPVSVNRKSLMAESADRAARMRDLS